VLSDLEATVLKPFLCHSQIAFHGRFGNIHLLSAKSFTKVFSLKMNEDVKSVAFSPDGEKLYSHGGKKN
jgi:U3 small nucleolar RNA-associated protein 18